MRLYCIPYAGGSSTIYNDWNLYLNNQIQVRPLELAGRGYRFSENYYQNMSNAIQDLISRIDHYDNNYAIFGHSMGALLAFELARSISAQHSPPPVHLFLSGYCPPNKKLTDSMYSTMDDAQLKRSIFQLGGTPKEIINNIELWKIFSNIVRADYALLDYYNYSEQQDMLSSNFSILTGTQDDKVNYHNLKEWENFTSGSSEIVQFKGGHFFINNEKDSVLKYINHTLDVYLT